MTITVPWRRITLQLSQRALTEALTFNGSSCSLVLVPEDGLLQSVGDAAASQVVGRELNPDAVPRQDPNEIHPELSRNVGQYTVAVLKLDSEHRVRKGFDDRSFDFDRVSLCHGRCWFPFSNGVPARRGRHTNA
jgi:hypothetical protein